MTAIKAAPGQVLGFDYTTGKPVAMPPAQWRDKYPLAQYLRTAGGGETFYSLPRRKDARGDWLESRIVAEAYAIIPAGRAHP